MLDPSLPTVVGYPVSARACAGTSSKVAYQAAVTLRQFPGSAVLQSLEIRLQIAATTNIECGAME